MSETWESILSSPTPQAWIDRALNSLDILLIDHAHCEKKAASSAISLIHKYPHFNLAKLLFKGEGTIYVLFYDFVYSLVHNDKFVQD